MRFGVTRQLAFLGPSGTYTEQAAVSYDPGATLVPFDSIPAVAAAADSGFVDAGVVPIENSLEGSVTFTLDVLIHESKLSICHELVLPIEHSLLAKPGTKTAEIRIVYSHPQALAQCQSFLREHFPKVELVASLSTSAAVEEMKEDGSVVAAAIASQHAAALYEVEVLAQGIQDNPDNATRFVVLARSDHPPTGRDKTSICFGFEDDAPGILYSVMGELAKRGINLSKVESRPTKQGLGRYIFLLDFEGHREDGAVRDALDAIKAQVSMLRIFGSYPLNVSSSV